MNHRPLPILMLLLAPLAGCPEPPPETCGEFDQVFAWEDADGDGFGAHVPMGWVCALGPNQSSNDGDCDDTRAESFPGAPEDCDLADNDCDGFVDEETPGVPWYADDDLDGWGDGLNFTIACEQPGQAFSRTAGDCDDTRSDVNPAAPEICNGGIDDDCDTFADDADVGVDPSSYIRWHRDADEDGYGDTYAYIERCAGPPSTIEDGSDCDDLDPEVNPDNTEVCNREDDDCDGLVDDDDPDVDPSGFSSVIADRDRDLYGSPTEMTMACWDPPGGNRLDCDDNDPLATVEQDWFVDTDGDHAGTGESQAFQCLNPGGGLAPEAHGVDCQPNEPSVFPRQVEDCFDGADQNCNQLVDCDDPDCAVVPFCKPPCADEVWTPASLPSTVNGNTGGARDDLGAGCGGGASGPDIAFWFTPPTSGKIVFSAQGSNYDTVLFARETCGGAVMACNDDFVGVTSRIEVTAVAGVPFLVVMDGYGNASGNFRLRAE